MATVIQIYDEATSTIAFDLNDQSGANASDIGYSATFLGGAVDWGGAGWEFERFQPPQSSGGTTTFSRAGLTTATIPLLMRASSYDNYAQAVGRLSRLISQGGTIKWIPDGSSRTLYYDFEPSTTPFYFDGRPTSMVEAVRLFGIGNGLTLQLTRQPFPRGTELDSATNLFTNATLLRDIDGAGRPDGWTWSSTSNISNENIDGAAEAFEFDMAVSGANRSLTQSTSAASAAVGQDWTVSGYVRVSSASMTNARAQAMLTWRTSAPADISTITSTLTALTSAWQRFSISGTAPATTDRIQGGMRFNNTSATSATIQLRNLQVEMASAVTPFHVGTENLDDDPATGNGRWAFFYNPGDVPTPVETLKKGGSGSFSMEGYAALRSNQGGPAGTKRITDLVNTRCLIQAEAMTQGTDTATQANNAAYSGSGNNYSRTTFATNTLTPNRLHTDLTTVLECLRGSFVEIWVRVAAATPGDEFTVRLVTNYVSGATAALESTYDLDFDVTSLASELRFGPIAIPSDIAQMRIALRAQRTSGAGNLNWDFVHLVPMDESVARMNVLGLSGFGPYYLHSDPSTGTCAVSDVNGATIAVAPIKGAVPFIAQPGLNAVYMPSTSTTTLSYPPTTDITNDAQTTRFIFSPRYFV